MGDAARLIDLVDVGFTLPGSRLVVRALDEEPVETLVVHVAEYERRPGDCVVVTRLSVVDGQGRRRRVVGVSPDLIDFDGGVGLTFAGARGLSIGAAEGGLTLEMELCAPLGSDLTWSPGLPSVPTAFLAGDVSGVRLLDGLVRIPLVALGRGVQLGIAGGEEAACADHVQHLARTHEAWYDWFEKLPAVAEEFQTMAAACWWVLGANIVELEGHRDAAGRSARVIVPSKSGYVGLWQWDAYFIAAGVRHGDLALAQEQLDWALRYQRADGQLPDVVHDGGVLATSDDLPTADREHLERDGSLASHPDRPLPLTKPPLAGWAVVKLAEAGADPSWARRAWEVIARSQQWWFDVGDSDRDGLPEYAHPYSSGLDDSPVFDGALPATTPDLAAFLVVQDDLLATAFDGAGEPERGMFHRRRATRTLALLNGLWDERAGRFRPRAGGRPIETHTIVDLLPLLTGRLDPHAARHLVADLADPAAFAAPYPVPTVARADPAFSASRMWRGPVWINTNALIIEGLRSSGYPIEAASLARRTLELVIHGGGPHEYFNPLTGLRAAGATTAFGWSAGLFIDLAVQLSGS